jgi:hypothetical protein
MSFKADFTIQYFSMYKRKTKKEKKEQAAEVKWVVTKT